MSQLEITLTDGKVALVDPSDHEWLSKWKWQARKSRDGVYAGRTDHSGERDSSVQMHRLIMGVHGIRGVQVDHINRNTLDNRRENLRLATPAENSRNRRIRSTNQSGYKGVSFHRRSGKWQARIGISRKIVHLGSFGSPESAYAAYCEAAKEHHGAFANV